MRDLKADLEICNQAPKGPYEQGREELMFSDSTELIGYRGEDNSPYIMARANYSFKEESEKLITFIVAAREGWPEAIKRAIKAEETFTSLREESDLQRQSIQSLSRQVVALHKTLDDIYPLIAGRVIQLRDAGEEKAMEAWNQAAIQVVKVLEGKPDQSTQDLTCQVVALREALEEVTEELENCYGRDTELTIKAREIINSPSPGANYQRVIETAKDWKKSYEVYQKSPCLYTAQDHIRADDILKQALADLEGGTSL